MNKPVVAMLGILALTASAAIVQAHLSGCLGFKPAMFGSVAESRVRKDISVDARLAVRNLPVVQVEPVTIVASAPVERVRTFRCDRLHRLHQSGPVEFVAVCEAR